MGCVMAATLCFAPNSLLAGPPEVKLGAGYAGIRVDVKTVRGVVFVIADAREIGGKVAVCGLVFFEKPTATLKQMTSQIASKIDYSIAGTRLTVNSSLFNRFETEAEAQAGNARCSVTATSWKATYAKANLTMKLGRGSIYE